MTGTVKRDVCGKDFETFSGYDKHFTLSPSCGGAKKWE
jgi:hypothetical protein